MAKNKSSRTGKQNWKKKFVQSLAKCPIVSVACKAAHISTAAAYDARLKDEEFAKAWARAAEDGVEVLEKEVWHRAVEGDKQGVWMSVDGEPRKVEEVRKVSDTLAIFLLKGLKPATYRDMVRTELTGPGGAPLPFAIQLTAAELPRLKKVEALPPADSQVVDLDVQEGGS